MSADCSCSQQTGSPRDEFVDFHAALPVRDERIATTRIEAAKILARYFDEDARELSRFPKKQKEKLIVLNRITEEFEPGRRYTEKEINEAIKAMYTDYVTVRRYLVEYGFLGRMRDGSEYWRVSGEAAADDTRTS